MRLLLLLSLLALGATLSSASAALSPDEKLVAYGTVFFEGEDCVFEASLVIERGLSPDAEGNYVGMGTGLLSFGSPDPRLAWFYVPLPHCGAGFMHFGGGQCFSCEGTCRVLVNGTAECWDGWGGSADAPDPAQPGGRYMRLDPDGAFVYEHRFGIPRSPDYTIRGTFTRVV